MIQADAALTCHNGRHNGQETPGTGDCLQVERRSKRGGGQHQSVHTAHNKGNYSSQINSPAALGTEWGSITDPGIISPSLTLSLSLSRGRKREAGCESMSLRVCVGRVLVGRGEGCTEGLSSQSQAGFMAHLWPHCACHLQGQLYAGPGRDRVLLIRGTPVTGSRGTSGQVQSIPWPLCH